MPDNYWWAGRGGARGGDSWIGADQPPDPEPSPGTGPVLGADETECIAATYDGPALDGNDVSRVGRTIETLDGWCGRYRYWRLAL